VTVYRRPGSALWRRGRSDASYASANDPGVLVGPGDATAAVRILVQWPDGETEQWTEVPVDRYTALRQFAGTPNKAKEPAQESVP